MAVATSATSAAADLVALWKTCSVALTNKDDGGYSVIDAWNVATKLLKPRGIDDGPQSLDPSQAEIDAVNALHASKLIPTLLEWHTEQVVTAIKSMLAITTETFLASDDVAALLVRLATHLQVWSQPYSALSPYLATSSDLDVETVSTQRLLAFRSIFVSTLRPFLARKDFIESISRFLESSVEPLNCMLELHGADPNQALLLNAIAAIHYLALTDTLEYTVNNVIYRAIEAQVAEVAEDFSQTDFTTSLRTYMTTVMEPWLISYYALALVNLPEEALQNELIRARAKKTLRNSMQKFELYLYTTLLRTRISHFFEIMVDFPDSIPAVQDITICINRTEQKRFLRKNIDHQLRKRLLHPGANTQDILLQYIALIRVMRIIDPSGVLLAKVANPVRAYLRSRNDTIRCIVQGMVTEDGPLSKDLHGDTEPAWASGAANRLLLRDQKDSIADDFTDDDYTWTPAPVDAPPNYIRNKAADVIQLLVGIYESRAIFVKELQSLMATRLIGVHNYNYVNEVRVLEVLKMRFGETELANIEVMLKDCADSKRLDGAIHHLAPGARGSAAASLTHPTVISHLFWPSYREEANLKLPGQLGRAAKAYQAAYAKIKPEKRVRWIHSRGTVYVEIELADRTLEFRVSPIKAAVIELFAEREKWSLEALQTALNMSETAVKAALHFWQSKGVLRNTQVYNEQSTTSKSSWETLENVPADMDSSMVKAMVEQPLDQAAQRLRVAMPVQDQAAQHLPIQRNIGFTSDEIQTYITLICNILGNLGALPADRLHSMLSAISSGFNGKDQSVLNGLLEEAESQRVLRRNFKGEWSVVR